MSKVSPEIANSSGPSAASTTTPASAAPRLAPLCRHIVIVASAVNAAVPT